MGVNPVFPIKLFRSPLFGNNAVGKDYYFICAGNGTHTVSYNQNGLIPYKS